MAKKKPDQERRRGRKFYEEKYSDPKSKVCVHPRSLSECLWALTATQRKMADVILMSRHYDSGTKELRNNGCLWLTPQNLIDAGVTERPMDKAQFKRNMKALELSGFMTRVRRGDRRTGLHSEYWLHHQDFNDEPEEERMRKAIEKRRLELDGGLTDDEDDDYEDE